MDHSRPARTPADRTRPVGQAPTVLVVTGNDRRRQALSGMLQALSPGCRVRLARDPDEARSLARADPPALVVADAAMRPRLPPAPPPGGSAPAYLLFDDGLSEPPAGVHRWSSAPWRIGHWLNRWRFANPIRRAG